MATKFINLNNLATFLAKLKTLFVAKELKTGSTNTYKVLSDNNLTDELVAKIKNAGDSTFSGAYADLTGKPAIGGKEIASGNQTAASLGLATPTDVTAAANNARTGAVNDIKNLGYQTAANVETAITAKGYQTAAQVNTIVTGKGYQTAANVDAKVNAAKTELQNSLGSAFRAKGSTMFASLPAPASATKGDVWNITDQFTTTDQFVDGSGKTLPAGTNVVAVAVTTGDTTVMKWDALTGMIDLSGYMRKTDITRPATPKSTPCSPKGPRPWRKHTSPSTASHGRSRTCCNAPTRALCSRPPTPSARSSKPPPTSTPTQSAAHGHASPTPSDEAASGNAPHKRQENT